MKVGDPITVWDGERARLSWVIAEIDGLFEVNISNVFRMRSHVRSGAEGIDWLPGHGPEIEAALDAAHRLLDDEVTQPFPVVGHTVCMVCSEPLAAGQLVALDQTRPGRVLPMHPNQNGLAVGVVAYMYPNLTADILLNG